MNISLDQAGEAIRYLIAFILSVTVHEFGHAWIATRLGDPTPKAQGRVTLLPTRHIDPIGTILMPLLMAFTAAPLLAWGKPVMTTPAYYTRRFSRATSSLFISLSGPLMNLAMAVIASVLAIVLFRVGVIEVHGLQQLFKYFIVLNLYLMGFNLLPLPPLDGGAILAWALPRNMQHIVEFLERWGGFILLGLVILGRGILDVIMTPIHLLVGRWAAVLAGLAGA